ncbi:MAG: hypothetical protein HOD62_08875, partial [Chloroflexi bacterium]|nr:hypothetical protein [Chloroflexota bacterium]
MNRVRYRGLILLLIASVAMIVTACSSDPVVETVIQTVIVAEKGDTITVVATPTATLEERTLATADAKKGGHLRVASVGSVQSFDPLWTTASSTGNVSSMILEGLFAYKEDNTIGKMLIDDWKVSSDGLKWTFKIREGVEFHNGISLTTDQVIGTLRRQSERAPVFKLVWEQFGPTSFDEFITKDSDLEFSMNLTGSTGLVLDALGPQNFAPQMVLSAWYSLPATESAEGTPIGTGPYRFESWTPGDRWSAIPFANYSPSTEASDGESG